MADNSNAHYMLLGGNNPEKELPNSVTIIPVGGPGIPLLSGWGGPVFTAINLAGGDEILVGVLAIINGGTNNGALPVTDGGVLYTDGVRFQNTGAGTPTQVLTYPLSGNMPTWKTPVDITFYSNYGGL